MCHPSELRSPHLLILAQYLALCCRGSCQFLRRRFFALTENYRITDIPPDAHSQQFTALRWKFSVDRHRSRRRSKRPKIHQFYSRIVRGSHTPHGKYFAWLVSSDSSGRKFYASLSMTTDCRSLRSRKEGFSNPRYFSAWLSLKSWTWRVLIRVTRHPNFNPQGLKF